MTGVVVDALGLVAPRDEEPVDGQGGEDHGHADGGFNRFGNHGKDGDGGGQDDVHDGEEQVDLDGKNLTNLN